VYSAVMRKSCTVTRESVKYHTSPSTIMPHSLHVSCDSPVLSHPNSSTIVRVPVGIV